MNSHIKTGNNNAMWTKKQVKKQLKEQMAIGKYHLFNGYGYVCSYNSYEAAAGVARNTGSWIYTSSGERLI